MFAIMYLQQFNAGGDNQMILSMFNFIIITNTLQYTCGNLVA